MSQVVKIAKASAFDTEAVFTIVKSSIFDAKIGQTVKALDYDTQALVTAVNSFIFVGTGC